MVSGSLLFLLGYVVPQFAGMYESLDAPMPWFTQIVLGLGLFVRDWWIVLLVVPALLARSAEHKSEPQSLMRISYAVLYLQKKIPTHTHLASGEFPHVIVPKPRK